MLEAPWGGVWFMRTMTGRWREKERRSAMRTTGILYDDQGMKVVFGEGNDGFEGKKFSSSL